MPYGISISSWTLSAITINHWESLHQVSASLEYDTWLGERSRSKHLCPLPGQRWTKRSQDLRANVAWDRNTCSPVCLSDQLENLGPMSSLLWSTPCHSLIVVSVTIWATAIEDFIRSQRINCQVVNLSFFSSVSPSLSMSTMPFMLILLVHQQWTKDFVSNVTVKATLCCKLLWIK